MKIQRGRYGYIKNLKKNTLIKTIVLFIFVAAIMITGYISTKTRLNYFTIGAVLMALPASKALVNFAVVAPHYTNKSEDYESLMDVASENATILSDMLISSAEKIMQVDFIIFDSEMLFFYVSDNRTDLDYVQRYLRKTLDTSCTIKGYSDLHKFLLKAKTVGREEEKYDSDKVSEMKSTLISLVMC